MRCVAAKLKQKDERMAAMKREACGRIELGRRTPETAAIRPGADRVERAGGSEGPARKFDGQRRLRIMRTGEKKGGGGGGGKKKKAIEENVGRNCSKTQEETLV